MATPISESNGPVLNSWKEIAQHLGRGVRTIQRWERDLGLPVRRPRGKSRSAVIALVDELDAWVRNTPTQEPQKKPAGFPIQINILRRALDDSVELRRRAADLRAAHGDALGKLMGSLEMMMAQTGRASVFALGDAEIDREGQDS
jgi:hypothetical protein